MNNTIATLIDRITDDLSLLAQCICGKHYNNSCIETDLIYQSAKSVVNVETHIISKCNQYFLARMVDTASGFHEPLLKNDLILCCCLGLLTACQKAKPVNEQCACQNFVKKLLEYAFDFGGDRDKCLDGIIACVCFINNSHWLKFSLKQYSKKTLYKLYECISLEAEYDAIEWIDWYCLNKHGFYKINEDYRQMIHERLKIPIEWWVVDDDDSITFGDPYRLFNSEYFYTSKLSLTCYTYKKYLMQQTARILERWAACIGAESETKKSPRVDYVWKTNCGHQVWIAIDEEGIMIYRYLYQCCYPGDEEDEILTKFYKSPQSAYYEHYQTAYTWCCIKGRFHRIIIEDDLYIINEFIDCDNKECHENNIILLYLLRYED